MNTELIRPFRITTPPDKGGERQPYLHLCSDIPAHELLYPGGECPEVFPGVFELKVKPHVLTPAGTSLLITTHPNVFLGTAPTIVPTVFSTDWWQGELKVWMMGKPPERGEPVALLAVVKRGAELREDEAEAFNKYVSENSLETRAGNLYERMSHLAETGKLELTRRKYRLL